MFLFLPNQNSSQDEVGKPLQATCTEKAGVYNIEHLFSFGCKSILFFNSQRLSILQLCPDTLHMLCKAETHPSRQALKEHYS